MILCWLCEFGACFCSCAQSGNGRHTSHQRKINQQEESCQNLTDFTPARVPSKVDIFTAYNDSLQCSHECVRTAVPVYTDEMIQHTPIYKTTYNGNRWATSVKKGQYVLFPIFNLVAVKTEPHNLTRKNVSSFNIISDNFWDISISHF